MSGPLKICGPLALEEGILYTKVSGDDGTSPPTYFQRTSPRNLWSWRPPVPGLHKGIPPHVPSAAVVRRVVVCKVGVDDAVRPERKRDALSPFFRFSFSPFLFKVPSCGRAACFARAPPSPQGAGCFGGGRSCQNPGPWCSSILELASQSGRWGCWLSKRYPKWGGP